VVGLFFHFDCTVHVPSWSSTITLDVDTTPAAIPPHFIILLPFSNPIQRYNQQANYDVNIKKEFIDDSCFKIGSNWTELLRREVIFTLSFVSSRCSDIVTNGTLRAQSGVISNVSSDCNAGYFLIHDSSSDRLVFWNSFRGIPSIIIFKHGVSKEGTMEGSRRYTTHRMDSEQFEPDRRVSDCTSRRATPILFLQQRRASPPSAPPTACSCCFSVKLLDQCRFHRELRVICRHSHFAHSRALFSPVSSTTKTAPQIDISHSNAGLVNAEGDERESQRPPFFSTHNFCPVSTHKSSIFWRSLVT